MRNASLDTRERIAARKWVQEAIRFYESAGADALLAEMEKPDGRFAVGDRCVFALDTHGTMLAHPLERDLKGKVLTGLKDSDGKAFIQKIIDITNGRGYGFIEYRWPHPESGKEMGKTVFFEKVDRIIFCSGFY
jgi:signal transduction histidine kinase